MPAGAYGCKCARNVAVRLNPSYLISRDMSSIATRGNHGFALTEAMVALLLLAIAMLGAGAALIQAVAGQRSALLQTRAADLAGDLAEALRAAPDAATAAAEIRLWQAAARDLLPQAQPIALPRSTTTPSPGTPRLPVRFDIRLQWRDSAAGMSAQLSLPLAVNAATGPS
jgi:type II secretory pathway pseudopilin PulG